MVSDCNGLTLRLSFIKLSILDSYYMDVTQISEVQNLLDFCRLRGYLETPGSAIHVCKHRVDDRALYLNLRDIFNPCVLVRIYSNDQEIKIQKSMLPYYRQFHLGWSGVSTFAISWSCYRIHGHSSQQNVGSWYILDGSVDVSYVIGSEVARSSPSGIISALFYCPKLGILTFFSAAGFVGLFEEVCQGRENQILDI
jgi:hypothetical protein